VYEKRLESDEEMRTGEKVYRIVSVCVRSDFYSRGTLGVWFGKNLDYGDNAEELTRS
jgi:hypothetical protein